LGQGAGQLLINIPDASGSVLFILTSILMSLAVLPVAVARVSTPELPKPTRFRIGRLWGISPTGMTAATASGTVMGAFYALGALFAQKAGLDVTATSQFMGAAIIGGLVLQWPIGKLSDRMDRRLVMAGVALLTAMICFLMMIESSHGGHGLLVMAMTFGGLSFTIYPLAVAYTNDYTPAEDMVPMAGGLMMSYGIGAAIGPIVAAPMMDLMGPGGLFAFIGGVCVALLCFIVFRITQRAPLPVEDQSDYQTIQRTSAVVYEFYPETENADQVDDPEDDTRC
jgi:MFS family permease